MKFKDLVDNIILEKEDEASKLLKEEIKNRILEKTNRVYNGKNMKHAIAFFTEYPGWHDYAKDRATVNAIKRLVKQGTLEVNEYHQARLKESVNENYLSESLRLTLSDKKVITAFTKKEEADSKHLYTDGKSLDGLWRGGNKIAYWEGDKVKFREIDSRSAQTIIRALKRMLPKNLTEMEYPYGKISNADLEKAEKILWDAERAVRNHEFETENEYVDSLENVNDDILTYINFRFDRRSGAY